MKLVLLLSLGMLVSGMGCGKKQGHEPGNDLRGRGDVQVAVIAESPQVSEWREKAKSRHLYWNIHCTQLTGADWAVLGRAGFSEEAVEFGGPESWYWYAFSPTQDGVAEKLIAQIDWPMNMVPHHEAERHAEPHRQCPPPLTGKP